jgi:hypothetical protein
MKLSNAALLSVLTVSVAFLPQFAFALPAVATHCEAIGPNASKAWLGGFDLVVRTNGDVATFRNMRVNPQGAYGNDLGSLLLPTEVG